MTIGSIIIMSFITLVLGFGCVVVVHDELRRAKEENQRDKL